MVLVPGWTCPHCDRSFGRRRQSHFCEPTAPLDEYLDTWPGEFRAVARAMIDEVTGLGPIDVEAAGVGLLFRTSRTIIELRPKPGRLELGVILDHEIEDPRVRRNVSASAGSTSVVVDLAEVSDLDDFVVGLLREAYATNPGDQPPGGV